MTQTITDYGTFLTDAMDAVQELNQLKRQEEQLKQEEQRLEKALEAEKKTVSDAINMTVKKRMEEVCGSYDREIGKSQDRLKRVRAKREKAKTQGVKDRIIEETSELREHNRELKVRMKTLFQQSHVPCYCSSGWYFSLYFTKGLKEAVFFLLSLVICFLVIPWGIYELIPKREPFYLAIIYFATIVVFGGGYVLIGNMTKGRHLDALREGRSIRNVMISNNKKIKVISSTIRKDKNEEIYNLEKFDDEIAQLEQDLAETARKKKEALNTFERVTKNIISDEIMDSHKEKIDYLNESYQEIQGQIKLTETLAKQQAIFITDNYEVYTGKEFLNVEKLQELQNIFARGEASNMSEAINVYKREK